MRCKVSVIIPFFNGIEYLRECVESVQNQTLREIEILLVDDGSTDGSGELADTFAAADARIRVLHQANAGVSAARNAGLDVARGEYVGFVDADDLAEPELFATLYGIAKEKRCQIVSCAHISFDGKDICYSNCPPSPSGVVVTDTDVLQTLPMMSTSALFEYVWRRIFSLALIRTHAVRFDPEISLGEDTLFCLECYLHADRTVSTDKLLYRYRHQPNSALRRKTYKPYLLRSLAKQYERKYAICEKHRPEAMTDFARNSAQRSVRDTLPLALSNVFCKPEKRMAAYYTFIRTKWVQDTLRYAQIPRSRSLDHIALRCMQKKLYLLGFCIAKQVYGKDKHNG